MKKSAARGPRASSVDADVELLKAVAQAWHAQSGNPRPSSRAGAAGAAADASGGAAARARAGAAARCPSRFKLEAMATAMAAAADARRARERSSSWDFAESLWDPYELVAVARRLESGLVVDDHAGAAATQEDQGDARRRRRESGRSLRSLFLRSTSKRFQEPSS